MTLDEALRAASDIWHDQSAAPRVPTGTAMLAMCVIHENADQLRRAHKLKEVEANAADLDKHNDLLEAENTKLEEAVAALRDERNKLEAEMTEKNKALADLLVELHKLKKAT
jgi:septal ring factor EnvC (AmiA/AmiB activator)